MAGLNEICLFVPDSVHMLYFWNHSNGFRLHILAYRGCTKKKTCRESLILVHISQAARFVGPTLNSLSSRHQFGPSWMFIHLELHVFMAVKWFRLAGWVMTPRSRVHRHRHLGGICCLILSHEDECSKFLRNSTTDYTEPHPIRPQYIRSQVPQFCVTEIQNSEFRTSFYVMCM